MSQHQKSLRTRQRHQAAQRLVKPIADGLPMPVSVGSGKVTIEERLEYRQRRLNHFVQVPDYDLAWERPTPVTASAICALLADWLPALDTICPDPLTAQQLVVVALDLAVSSGRYGHLVRRRRNDDLRHVRRPVTRTRVFEAIARRWSDRDRQVRENGRAYSIAQMAETTVEAIRREILRLDISLPHLWQLVIRQDNPLFAAHTFVREGKNITLREGPVLDEFERLVSADKIYGPTRAETSWRLWVVGQEQPSVHVAQSICAEQPYNTSELGAGTEEVLGIQQDTQLLFLSTIFMGDWAHLQEKLVVLQAELKTRFPTKVSWMERSPEERRLRKSLKRLRAFRLEFQSIHDQILDLRRVGYPFGVAGAVLVRSAFAKVLNRRFQSLHLFPMSVSDKPGALNLPELAGVAHERDEQWGSYDPSQRLRWFSFPGSTQLAPMVSADISSSQTQLLAVFMGIEPLEQTAIQSDIPFKLHLAQQAWTAPPFTGTPVLAVGYTGPDDPQLVDACKNLWMRFGYGSTIHRVIRDHAKVWKYGEKTYGPGWGTKVAVSTFLASIPGFADVENFLQASRHIGRRAGAAGLTLTDPIDGAAFRWNPVQLADVRLSWDRYEISIIAPGRYPTSECATCHTGERRIGGQMTCKCARPGGPAAKEKTWSVAFEPNTLDPHTGEWPIRQHKLKNMVAPCLVHMLDALFAAEVMRALRACGVRDFVAIHDAFYLPETLADGTKGLDVLREALHRAGHAWLRALGPVYAWLSARLIDTPWASMIDEAHAGWLTRLARAEQCPPTGEPGPACPVAFRASETNPLKTLTYGGSPK